MRELVQQLLKPVQKRLQLSPNDDLLLLVNNLGGLTEIEQLNFVTSILQELAEYDLKGKKSLFCFRIFDACEFIYFLTPTT